MKLWKAIPIVLLLVATVVGGIWALTHLIGLKGSLVWTGLVALVAWAVRSNVERKRAHESLLAEQKREQYFRFIDFLNEYIGQAGNVENTPEKLAELRRWSLRLTMIGSDDVMRAWNTVRTYEPGSQGEDVGLAVFLTWGTLLLEMRKDCGHYATELNVRDMLASVINDLDDYLANALGGAERGVEPPTTHEPSEIATSHDHPV